MRVYRCVYMYIQSHILIYSYYHYPETDTSKPNETVFNFKSQARRPTTPPVATAMAIVPGSGEHPWVRCRLGFGVCGNAHRKKSVLRPHNTGNLCSTPTTSSLTCQPLHGCTFLSSFTIIYHPKPYLFSTMPPEGRNTVLISTIPPKTLF